MTVDFLNIAAIAARQRYLRLSEGLHSPSASSYYYYCYLCKKVMLSSALVCLFVGLFVC